MKNNHLKPHLTTDMRRKLIAKAYKNDEWKNKVQTMNHFQVYAIYDKFVKEGRIYYDEVGVAHFRTSEELKKLKEAQTDFHTKCHQITIDEWLEAK